MIEIAAPLVPADLDVSGFSGFLLEADRLLGSTLMATGTGDEIKAALVLWCRAWTQVPAASLPGDEGMLAKLAGVSRAKWRHIKAVALHGFVRCVTDGRLYHPVLAEHALRAGKALAERGAAGRRGRQKQVSQQAQLPLEPTTSPAKSPPDFSRKPLKSNEPGRASRSLSPIQAASSEKDAPREALAAPPDAAALRGDDQQEGVLAAVEREIHEAWPEAPRRRHAADAEAVAEWAAAGISAERVVGTVRMIARRDADAGRPPPVSLRYFGAVVRAAPRRAGRSEPAPSGWVPNSVGEWGVRLRAWHEKGVWLTNFWGPKPGERGCEVPRSLLAAQGAALRGAVVPA